jgi:hypothetical protein
MRPWQTRILYLKSPHKSIEWGAFSHALMDARRPQTDVKLRYDSTFDLIMRARIRKPRGPNFTLSHQQYVRLVSLPMLRGHQVQLDEDMVYAALIPIEIARAA